jgi:hypothetical protein
VTSQNDEDASTTELTQQGINPQSYTQHLSLSSSLTSDPLLPCAISAHNTKSSWENILSSDTSLTAANGLNMDISSNLESVPLSAPSSVIYDSARITDWRKVQSLALSHPHHASYMCTDGLTPLHHVCSRRCPLPPVFQALIKAYPKALLVRDETKGWTPLHHACRFKCNREGVRLLLQSIPEYGRYAAKVRDKERGRTPLYYAIRYDAPDGVVELLLQSMNRTDILDCDRDGMSVLGLVWDRWVASYEGKRQLGYYVKIVEQWKEKFRAASTDEDSEIVWNQILADSKKLREGLKGKLKVCWDRANMILRGAFQFPLQQSEKEEKEVGNSGNLEKGRGDEEQEDVNTAGNQDNSDNQLRMWRILHATVAIKCHPSLFLMAAVLHPEQIRQIDCNDLFQQEVNHHVRTLLDPATKDVLTALHLAAKAPSTGSESKVILQHLLLFHPKAAKMKNPKDGCLPLHYLCENESKQHWVNDGIRYVYDAYRQAAIDQDSFGRTPLHRAAALHDTHLYFIPSPPSFLGSPNRFHSQSSNRSHSSGEPVASSSRYSTSTAEAIGSSSRNSISSVDDPVGSIIQNIIVHHPQVAHIPDFQGKLLMHCIADCAENWDSNVQAIYDAYPEALSHRETQSKSLPLHLVASNVDAKPKLIQMLVKYHPRAASIMNGNGRLPLHLACESGKNWYGGMEDIFNAYPQAINLVEADERGWLPLHFLVSCPFSSVDTIQQVLTKSPNVAKLADYLGRTPFHLAVETGKDWNEGGLELLFQANPEAIDTADSEGKIPLVTALLTFVRNDGVSSNVEHDANTIHRIGDGTSTQMSLSAMNEHTEFAETTVATSGSLRACNSFESDLSQLNVLFHLLRAAPHVLSSADN